jgi:cardiolipin synthase
MYDGFGGRDGGTRVPRGARARRCRGARVRLDQPALPARGLAGHAAQPPQAARGRRADRVHGRDQHRRQLQHVRVGRLSEHGWRDTQIRIEGPAVAEFQRLFFADWEREVGPIRDEARYWPTLQPRGGEWVRAVAKRGADVSDLFRNRFVRFVRTHVDRHRHAIYASYLAAISESRKRVWITQAYFAPNAEFRDALVRAARRGCDVRLIVPANNDVGLVYYASRHQYAPLLQAGVRIFEYQGTVLHAKTAVVDGVWSTVGSSNLDYQSFVHNDEANATIIGAAFAREMERMFERDLANAHEVTLDAWRERPIRDRMLQALANQLKYWI